MLLTITTDWKPATDLGFLLHKHPERLQAFDLPFGKAHVFYSEVSDERCTAALLLDVDPVGLVRRRGPKGEPGLLHQYVNDRPYVASSFLSVAIARVLKSALKGESKERPDAAAAPIPLRARIAVLSCRGGEDFLRRLFEPLGYRVTAEGHPLDPQFPEWGQSRYFGVTLETTCRLSDLLRHLYVLVPVLDDEKHYWVGHDEVDKLLHHGEGWLASHPEREAITTRYLKHQGRLVRDALARLVEEETPDPDLTEEVHDAEEAKLEGKLSLNEQRIGAVVSVLKSAGARRVLDLGCGEGRLLRSLLADRQFETLVGMDVSWRSLELAASRLKLDRLAPIQRDRVKLIHGSLMYRDRRLERFDAACVVEVIEHLDAPRLAAFERVVFEYARPGLVVVTTPNAEYNVRWPMLPAGQYRHRDHRFEWGRTQFEGWARDVAQRHGYSVKFLPVGENDPDVGPPTQMGVFTR